MEKKTELLFKLDKLKTDKFELDMKDHWKHEDFMKSGSLNIEIRETERELEKYEKGEN